MTTLVLQAAQSAAQADGIQVPNAPDGMRPPQQRPQDGAKSGNNISSSNSSKKGPPLRRGKWTTEEEAYANRLIQEFKAGLLPLTDGTTLRTFLSKLLNCDPMRISKKFVGSNCIGKQVFRRRTADLNRLTPEQIQKSRAELSELERRFLERVAQTNRVKSNSMVTTGGPTAGGAPTSVAAAQSSPVDGSGGSSNPLTCVAANSSTGSYHNGGSNGPSTSSAADFLAGNSSNAAAMSAFMAAANEQQQQRAALLGMAGNSGGAFLDGIGGNSSAATLPWLLPPNGYKQGQGAAFAAANLSSNPSAAAAGRALLGSLMGGGMGGNDSRSNNDSVSAALGMHHQNDGQSSAFGTNGSNSASDLLAQLQRRASQQSFLRDALSGNQGNNSGGGANGAGGANHQYSNSSSSGGLSSAALAQLAQNASAVRLAGLTGSNGGSGSDAGSMANLLHAGGASDHLAAARGLSTASLSNAMKRKNSFDALMSLDFQSLQSIDNLANLIQTGGAQPHPLLGVKNADFGLSMANSNLSSAAQRLASAGRLGSLLSSNHHFSDSHMGATGSGGGDNVTSMGSSAGVSNSAPNLSSSSANLNNFLRSMDKESAASFLGGALGNHHPNGTSGSNNSMTSPSAVNMADLLRQDSCTGLSALRVQDGLTQRNSSVDDFLSLMAAGDIPHQDPGLLNIPLMQQQLAAAAAQQQQQQNGGGNGGNSSHSDIHRLLAQQQFLQSNPALANVLSSRSLANLQQHAAAAAGQHNESSSKRKLEELESVLAAQQQNAKRPG